MLVTTDVDAFLALCLMCSLSIKSTGSKCSMSQGGALKDSSHKDQSLFSWEGLTQKGLWSVALISLCQAWSLSHIRHTNDRQPGAYHTLNKRGHIPCVFPHEDTSCSRGREGYWESTGDWPRMTLPLPKVLSALFVFSLSLCLHYLHPSIHLYLPLCFPLSSSLPLDL